MSTATTKSQHTHTRLECTSATNNRKWSLIALKRRRLSRSCNVRWPTVCVCAVYVRLTTSGRTIETATAFLWCDVWLRIDMCEVCIVMGDICEIVKGSLVDDE